MNTKDKFLEDGVTPNPHYIDPAKETEEQRIERLAQEKADKIAEERLADIKKKLDGAYASRDTALAEAEALKLKEREAEKKALEEQGKYKELYELQLKERDEEIARERAAKTALEQRNTELSRDVQLKDALKGLNFRNGSAQDMAYGEIANQLVRNDKGEWVHKTGISIADFVVGYAKNEEKSFLFKAKSSSGGGSTTTEVTTTTTNPGKSLFSMKQADVLKLAEEGKLPQRK
jgi:hypothetical protein